MEVNYQSLIKAVQRNDLAETYRLSTLVQDINACIEEGENETVLHWAARYGNAALLQCLLNQGASNEVKSTLGYLPIHYAAIHGNAEACAFLLSIAPWQLEDKAEFLETPLHLAANAGQTEVCRCLLARGAKINPINEFGSTPIVKAAFDGHIETCQVLIEHGADLGMPSELGGYQRASAPPFTLRQDEDISRCAGY